MNTPPLFVRALSTAERAALEKGRTSAAGFTVRRSQVLLARADRLGPAAVGRIVGCTAQAVRNAIRAFHADGLGCLAARSHARQDPGRVGDRGPDENRQDLLHRRPRAFGKPTRLWTLALVAQVGHEKGWTPRVRSIEAVRQGLKRLGVGWAGAEHGITSPDPAHARRKSCGTG